VRAAAVALGLVAILACAAEAPVVITDKPVTTVVPVPAAVRGAHDILLQLQQVTVPKNASATWNMFVEMPSANAKTSTEAPGFAGYVTTLPNPSAAGNPPKGMTMQLPDAAAAIVRKLDQVRLTFVPVTTAPGETVKVGSVRLEPAQ